MIELTAKQLRQAASIKDKIESLQSDLNRLLGGSGGSGKEKTVGNGRRRKNKMSAAGRARISAAAKARWAKIKAGKK